MLPPPGRRSSPHGSGLPARIRLPYWLAVCLAAGCATAPASGPPPSSAPASQQVATRTVSTHTVRQTEAIELASNLDEDVACSASGGQAFFSALDARMRARLDLPAGYEVRGPGDASPGVLELKVRLESIRTGRS